MKLIIENKKRMAIIVAALGLVIGIFGVVLNNTVSEAAVSPQGGVTVGGVHFNATCDDGTEVVTAASGQSSNVPAGANVVGSVSVKAKDGSSLAGKTGTLSMGASDPTAFANVAYKVYIDHEDGSTDVKEGTFDSLGRASFSTTFSNFTLVATPNTGGTGTNTSSTSPQTGDLA